jgi:hypothetical protein
MGREHRRNSGVRDSYVCQPLVEIKEDILFDNIQVNVMQAEDAMEIRFKLRKDMTLWARREEELHGKINTHGKEFLQQPCNFLGIGAFVERINDEHKRSSCLLISKGFLKQEIDLSFDRVLCNIGSVSQNI